MPGKRGNDPFLATQHASFAQTINIALARLLNRAIMAAEPYREPVICLWALWKVDILQSRQRPEWRPVLTETLLETPQKCGGATVFELVPFLFWLVCLL